MIVIAVQVIAFCDCAFTHAMRERTLLACNHGHLA
jgi:hypothetical protein